MNLFEGVSFRHTPAPKKQRKEPGYWNWPELIAMAEKAVATGEEQRGVVEGTYFAVVKPEYGLAEDKRTLLYLETHEKVRITLYSVFFTLGATKGETVPCPWVGK